MDTNANDYHLKDINSSILQTSSQERNGVESENIEKVEISIAIKILDGIIVLFLGIFIPKLAFFISDILFEFGTSAWDFTHHILQLAFALLVISLPIWKKSLKEFGLNFKNWRWALRTVLEFIIIYIVALSIGTLITQIISGWPPIIQHERNLNDYLRTISFSGTMPGLSEEIVFRAMVLGILSRHWSGKFKIGKTEITFSNFFAAVIFSAAHIGFTLFPFQITYFNLMQICFSMGLGLFYGVLLERSKSLLGPMIAHNASDIIAVTIYYVITLVFM
ncbi:lysostaphin resistance A-like protein [Promethearchaeum syntrophicum]|uniref:Lysostaphin resistance A-like protein n=1 Tax=Promethearchaeum syntrophicum TaxID=2594042 RepID=A0A5B9DDS1_9ARCH|nr:type II CAAX endopeptidase family protein [Candidatus Prometheoarchaeum syntrophicum]QEE16913.1 CAAX amino terminal protease self- immunity [Candidatus Prometheoarchaeum syntrophicum]